MEDSVDESESLVSISKLKAEVQNGEKQEDVDQEKENRGGGDVGEQQDVGVAQEEDNSGGDDDKGVEVEEPTEAHKELSANSTDGGFFDQLISNLPAIPIPDALSPQADEASLLISIVED